jgi:hypothetical protein
MKRRDFLKTSLVASALGGLSATTFPARAADAAAPTGREYYELRVYRLKEGATHELLDSYLEKALLPALNRLGVKPVGVFTETEPKDGPGVFVLVPYSSIEDFARVRAAVDLDPEYLKAGADYLKVAKSNPAFVRIDSWLMLAFAGLPKLELPAYCKAGKPRLFELRTYESHGEAVALNKVAMFNAGEIATMREVGLAPIFYGQSLIGPSLPHLIYMTSAETKEAHKQHWADFGKHPVWQKLKSDPQYADNVSKITSRILVPAPFSQI